MIIKASVGPNKDCFAGSFRKELLRSSDIPILSLREPLPIFRKGKKAISVSNYFDEKSSFFNDNKFRLEYFFFNNGIVNLHKPNQM
ncbi:hypothetical protein Pedsa_2192 [Pseudopedobacter saltans DSM 12145]|uniref:Uncharacterized protein n=1 Tax=Pseudopedobacter saltans (strain ATCC 51119 / DSM 12145 / JCM 21818 / CCUG 39354 / LMG 10337 / NBRC 100064 / NCIMB 13643) TaxID=762903 RepID=F0SBQ3_PSESL|nr:hypothetical protein Pedsa_2192 [Pseudopedobacter saltans DSM 12145]